MDDRLSTHWSRLGRGDLERMQAARLRDFLVRRVIPFSRHYRELFRRERIRPETIRRLEDLRWIPFTTKDDLRVTPERPDRARDFVLIPDEALLRRRPSVLLRGLVLGRKRVRAALGREYRPIFLTSTTGRS